SQAKRVALKPAGSCSDGKRFSVCGPVFGGSWPCAANSSGAATLQATSKRPNRRRRMGHLPGLPSQDGQANGAGGRQRPSIVLSRPAPVIQNADSNGLLLVCVKRRALLAGLYNERVRWGRTADSAMRRRSFLKTAALLPFPFASAVPAVEPRAKELQADVV